MATNLSQNQVLFRGSQVLPPDDVIFGRSTAMTLIRQRLEKVCATDVPILIQGDAGTGKEVIARWVHSRSPWRAGPFVKVNCAAIPGTLLESELFGYEKGAFTGAYTSKPGRVELAKGGTLFLDEIGDLDPLLQAKLLQVLQDGEFSRLGDHEERRMDARVICASNRRIEEAVEAGKFRQDLFYRINVFHVVLPRLAARREDIHSIANHLLVQLSSRFQREVSAFSPRMLQMLQCWEWCGNIRELENRIARYVLLGVEDALEVDLFARRPSAFPIEAEPDGSIPLKRISEQARREIGRELILKALQANHWNRRKAAQVLQISYRTLLYKIREAGLPPKRPRTRLAVPAGEMTSSTLSGE